jgi:Domain of unknown function (DUF4864)
MRALFALFLTLFLAFPATARAQSDADKSAIQTVIDGQLKAFAADNGAGAYEFAAPMIKGIFPDPDTFMSMVKRGYQPVYRNKTYSFGEVFQDNLGRPAQRVVITATDGKRYEAVYSMEKQPDGSWKIAGCYLIAIKDLDV